MRRRVPVSFMRTALVALLSAVLAALVVGNAAAASGGSHPGRAKHPVTVATYNLYLGANLQPLFGATSLPDLVARAGQVYANVVRTNFPERAAAIADLLAETRPDVVGLQEVALWETGPIGGELTPSYDFLDLLLDALAERGHPYRAVVSNANFAGQLPISATTEARFTDHDVVIVRADHRPSRIETSNPQAQNFAAKLQIPTPVGITFDVPRGWSTVDVKLRGRTFRFANTHLEAFSEVVRNLQARELYAALAASPNPVVLVGDLNSEPSDTAGAYGLARQAGYDDAWVVANGPDGGFTSGQTDALNEPSKIDHRIDYVLYRSVWQTRIKAVRAEVIGEEDADRTPSGLWPSDHAGVVASLQITRR